MNKRDDLTFQITSINASTPAYFRWARFKTAHIQASDSELEPLPGAVIFWLVKRTFQVIIFVRHFLWVFSAAMRQLVSLTLCSISLKWMKKPCDWLQTTPAWPKRQSVRTLQLLNYRVIAAVILITNTTMLAQLNRVILFINHKMIKNFPQFPAVQTLKIWKKPLLTPSVREWLCNDHRY